MVCRLSCAAARRSYPRADIAVNGRLSELGRRRCQQLGIAGSSKRSQASVMRTGITGTAGGASPSVSIVHEEHGGVRLVRRDGCGCA